MSEKRPGQSRRLGPILAVVFLIALLLGPGPGSMLIDGSAAQPNFLFGAPALYVWLVFWCAVLSSCIVIAARCLWRDED